MNHLVHLQLRAARALHLTDHLLIQCFPLLFSLLDSSSSLAGGNSGFSRASKESLVLLPTVSVYFKIIIFLPFGYPLDVYAVYFTAF